MNGLQNSRHDRGFPLEFTLDTEINFTKYMINLLMRNVRCGRQERSLYTRKLEVVSLDLLSVISI